MPVEGSRHYRGAGLGQEGLWGCPSCGGDNAGPIAAGCAICGAGRPGQRIEAPPPPAGLNVAEQWALEHPGATLVDAFTAGYVEGVRIAIKNAPERKPEPEPVYTADGKVARTIIAALELFRDQVLASNPEETATGEWLNAAEVSNLIRRLQLEVEEPAHA